MSELEKEYFWKGSVPEDWKIIPAGIVFSESKELAGHEDLHLTPSQNYGVITQDEYRKITGHQLVRSTKSAVSMKHVEPDDFIISMASHLSGLERSRVTGKVSGDYRVLRPNPLFSPDYLGYLMKSHDIVESLNLLTTEIRVGQRISYDRFSLLHLPFPPISAQRAIADYLDRETAEIDGMRADLDEMERLLEERRVSIIQRHVLPENGTYTRIKLVADVSLGKTVQKTQKDASEVLCNYVRAAHIQPHGRLVLDDQPMWFTPNELKQLTLETGDVLVVEGGAGYGRSVYLREDLPGWGFQNHVIRVRPWGGASGRFIDYTFRAHYDAGLIDILADGATIPGLSSDKARELTILNVSYAEQRRIADEIDRETAEIDSILEDITKLRDLLAERRAAVISAAVTGQIDIPASLDDKDEPHA